MVDAAGAVAIAAIPFVWVWLKAVLFAKGDGFRASRISSGNHLFPTQVLITPTAVVQFTPRWFGKRETIHMAHIAPVKVETGMVLSDVFIETRWTDRIACHGHRKGDATRMKDLTSVLHDYRGGSPALSAAYGLADNRPPHGRSDLQRAAPLRRDEDRRAWRFRPAIRSLAQSPCAPACCGI